MIPLDGIILIGCSFKKMVKLFPFYVNFVHLCLPKFFQNIYANLSYLIFHKNSCDILITADYNRNNLQYTNVAGNFKGSFKI